MYTIYEAHGPWLPSRYELVATEPTELDATLLADALQATNPQGIYIVAHENERITLVAPQRIQAHYVMQQPPQ